MEIQIGQVNIKIRVNVFDRKMAIQVIAPTLDFMAALIVEIDGNNESEPLTYNYKTYKRGDKDAEKSAIS